VRSKSGEFLTEHVLKDVRCCIGNHDWARI